MEIDYVPEAVQKATMLSMGLKMSGSSMYAAPKTPGLFPHIPGSSMDVKKFVAFNSASLIRSHLLGSTQRLPADDPELGYIEQLQRYPSLPLDAHRKIRQMGNEIIHYFEARLIHVENPNSIGTFDSFIVFLKSPSTAQHWVMAFVKEQDRVLVKFNRLLTVHVRVSMQNPLTIDIEPSKSPKRRVDEQFIFNFENQRVCAEFLRVLNICKKEVWTRRGLPHPQSQSQSQTQSQAQVQQQQQPLQLQGRSSSSILSSSLPGHTNLPSIASMRPNKSKAELESMTLSALIENEAPPRKKFTCHENPILNMVSRLGPGPGPPPGLPSKNPPDDNNVPAPPKFLRFPYRMKFMLRYSAVLSVRKDKKSIEYGALGVGTLKIWGNDDCFDQLDFIAPHTNELICSHPIYSWNSVTLTSDDEHREYFCKWNAAADILAAPTSLPAVREFRVIFPTLDLANAFKAAFEESCAKASRPEIIFKSNQITPNVYQEPDATAVGFNSLF